MTFAERGFNLLAGLSVLSWAVLGMTATDVETRLTPVRVTVTLVHVVVGSLFLLRAPLLRHGPLRSTLWSLPSVVVCGLAFKLAPPLDRWPVAAEGVFIVGAAIATAAFVSLGRSFAILPAVRGTVDTGPYAVVRHPAYVGELLVVLGCFVAGPTGVAALPLAAALPCAVARLLAEESVLVREASYRGYAARVRWRLVPGVW